jgi:flagellar basal body L-ring protein FlgH
VVWVLNRDNPIKDDSSKLTISQDGNLMLVNQNESLVWWSTNISTKASSRVVQILHNGNLVLKDEINNNGEIFCGKALTILVIRYYRE